MLPLYLALAARREYPALAPAPRRDYNQLELLNAVTDAFPAYLAALFGWFVAFGILWDPMSLKTFWSSAVPGTVFLTLATAYCGWLTTSNFFWIIPLFFALSAVAAPFGKFMDKVSYGAGADRSWTSSSSSLSGGRGRFGGGGASGSW
jgi:uncharacterized membrane protein YgcG